MPNDSTVKPRFLCPNCGAQREAASAPCSKCHYHHLERIPAEPSTKTPHGPFQFHLRTVFIGMTIAAIVFAAMIGLGLTTFAKNILFALVIGGSFMPLVAFYFWWKRQGFEDK